MGTPNPRSDREMIADFLSRYHIPGQPKLSREEALDTAGRMMIVANASDAELYANGHRFVTVEHGYPESKQDDERIHALSLFTETCRGVSTSIRSSGDITTWIFHGDGAETAADDFERYAQSIKATWWKIRQAAR